MARIVLCDDAMFMRQSLVKILQQDGHVVVGEAGTGIEGIKKYRELRPDFILMDITMPDLDGIDATRQIKSEFPDAKIIMVSAMGQQDKVCAAVEAGACDFIVKPFNPAKILSCIKKNSER